MDDSAKYPPPDDPQYRGSGNGRYPRQHPQLWATSSILSNGMMIVSRTQPRHSTIASFLNQRRRPRELSRGMNVSDTLARGGMSNTPETGAVTMAAMTGSQRNPGNEESGLIPVKYGIRARSARHECRRHASWTPQQIGGRAGARYLSSLVTACGRRLQHFRDDRRPSVQPGMGIRGRGLHGAGTLPRSGCRFESTSWRKLSFKRLSVLRRTPPLSSRPLPREF